MKISAEVREFARLQETAPPPSAGEGDSAPAALSGERGLIEAEAGMAEMSKRFHDEGGELYVPAAGVEAS
jgi:phosphomethylpyrimidine synthase